MTKQQLLKIVAAVSVIALEAGAVGIPVLAQTMPDKQQLSAQITAQATAQTSTINANTSSSSSSSTPSTTTSVTNTGSSTSTSTDSNTSTQTQVANQNTATVNQTTNAIANTGGNDASRNISIGGNAGVISTGNATVNTTQVTQANTNGTAISTDPSACSSALDAVNTGNNTTTSSSCNANTTTLVNNGNTTVINQTTNALANTGGNTAARNISIGGVSGVITTGNATTNTNSLVTANGSVMLVGGASNGHGPGSGASIVLASASNAARFTSLANANSFFIINNDNRATIAQTCGAPLDPNQLFMNTSACVANTGGNNSSRNIATGGSAGVINTGDAVLNVAMIANTNNNGVVLSYPSSTGQTNAQIINTGDNTSATVASNNNQTTAVTNTNSAGVNQTVNAVADTGHNIADRNIAFGGNAGVIKTGNATVNTFSGVSTNINQTQINPQPVTQGSNGDPYATILNTGEGFNFNSGTNSNSVTTVNNSNLLSLVQSVTTNVSTGFNQIVGSIGTNAGGITTGNVNSAVQLEAVANDNTTVIGPTDPFLNPIPTPVVISPTPTPSEVVTGATQTVSPTPSVLLIGGNTGNSTNQSFYYYTSSGTYPYYPGYAYFARVYPRGYNSSSLSSLGRGHLLQVQPGDVLAAENGTALAAPQSQLSWLLLTVLSSLVGLGVYISRHSFLDPSLYR